MAAATPTRVLVHLKKNNNPARLASFKDCILSYFGYQTGSGTVFVQLDENRLTVSNTSLVSGDQCAIMKHPSFCPVFNLYDSKDHETLTEDVAARGIDVGVAIILESGDGKVLLTKRGQHLRTFPGIWVPPGGHVELNESLIEAGLRELKEETGLSISTADCIGQIKLLALWESVFPPKLSVGPPKRHHTVVYFHLKLKDSLTAISLESQLKFDPGEVGACAWMERQLVQKIVEACEETSSKEMSSELTFSALVLNDKQEQCKRELPLAPLLKTLPTDNDIDRVSTGTKFALEQFLKL